MGKHVLQIPADDGCVYIYDVETQVLQIPADDGCVYIYDVETQVLRKLCEVTRVSDVPDVVKETLSKALLLIKVKENGG
jgi:hypothetical protein